MSAPLLLNGSYWESRPTTPGTDRAEIQDTRPIAAIPDPDSPRRLPTPKASATMPHKWWGAPKMAEGGGDEKASGSTRTVFISYASQDAGVAAALVVSLERTRVSGWIGPHDVK